MIATMLYFILALILLIVVHEFGHFIVARWMGVKVLRFSVGFGNVLARWYDKRGTEYAFSLIPLGGYVKMLDESEAPVPKNERHLAFNNKSVWARIAIVIAGPFFNFLFAFCVLWLALVIGIKSLAPIVDAVKPGSIAQRAGLTSNQEIMFLNGKKITSWRDFQYALLPMMGSDESIELTVKSLKNNQLNKIIFPLKHWQLDTKNPDVLASFGITPFIPSIPPVVGDVVAESPAEMAGLQVGDIITEIDAKPVNDWLFLVQYVREHPNKHINITLKRNGELKTITMLTGSVINDGKTQGLLGVQSQRVTWPENWLRLQRKTPLQAISTAFSQTVSLTGTTITLIGRLIMGKLPIQSISGPVGIAQGAGESGRSGLAYYLSFLALVSISLGVLNILPIPMLDGGHLLYYFIEIIRRKPLSEEIKSVGVYVGLFVLIILMVIGLGNDLTRLAG